MVKLFAFIITLGVFHIPTALCSGIETMREDDSVLCTEHLDGSSNCESGVHTVSLLQSSMKVEQKSQVSKRKSNFTYSRFGPYIQGSDDCEELLLDGQLRVCGPRTWFTYVVLCGVVLFIFVVFYTDCFGFGRKGLDVYCASSCIGLALFTFMTFLNNPGFSFTDHALMFPWHPVMMTLAFPCLMTLGRWSYHIDPSWGADAKSTQRKMHAFCMGTATLAALAGYLAIVLAHEYHPASFPDHIVMKKIHYAIGRTVLLSMILQMGVGITKAMNLIDGEKSMTFHGFLGKITLGGGLVQMLHGYLFWAGFAATTKAVLIPLLASVAYFAVIASRPTK